MTPKEQLIESLRRLCTKEGGHALVADEIGSSEATLWQVLSGTKLPSGEPRGVGPEIQRRLTARYPGWADLYRDSNEATASGTHQGAMTSLGGAVAQVAAALADLPPSRRKTIAHLAATQINDGANADEIAQIDALAPGVTVRGFSAWRSAAFGLAEKHPDLEERERLTAFIQAVDRFLTEAPAARPEIPATHDYGTGRQSHR